jgi:ribonuclease P protein component
MNQLFGKNYKLCSQKIIDALFLHRKSVKSYPFVLQYGLFELKENVPFQITVSVPKRMFKKAHDRNRIKRLMRECIRKNKLILEPFLNENNKQVALFMIYTAREELDYVLLEKKTKHLFNQLINEISSNDTIKIN